MEPKYRWLYFIVLVWITLGAFLTRYDMLASPSHVVWDETHFGKFASYYINRTFFLDVHPPLGKMAIAFAGYMTGYDGSFAFEKPGQRYGEYVEYLGMRRFCAFCGAMCIPLAYLTVFTLTGSLIAAFLTCELLIYDTGMVTISQYILLDPILMVSIMFSVYFMVCVQTYHRLGRHFTVGWWIHLAMTGISLGCAISVKWVGLFVVLLVGLATACELFDILTKIDKSLPVVLKHFLARSACLIVLPIAVYILSFAVHFHVLSKSGSGDAFFSSAFQSTLDGNGMANCTMPAEVAYGSVITLRNGRIAGGLLHSHPHLYPAEGGVQQQQITEYHHRDDNNKWIIRRESDSSSCEKSSVRFVKHGDYIRLEHLMTRRLLHSHYHKAPLSKKHYQATAYGFNGSGDTNDVWQIQIVMAGTPLTALAKSDGSPFVVRDRSQHVLAMKSRVILVHKNSYCSLHATSKALPKWGFEQKEVSCNPRVGGDVAGEWMVENHYNERLSNTTLETLKPSLLEKIFESHIVMAQTNSGFKPKPEEQTSRPWMWPLDYQGQTFSVGNKEGDMRVYLLGNPVVWWTNGVVIMLYVAIAALHLCILRRGIVLPEAVALDFERTFRAGGWLLIGWLLHYVPFFMMGRVLYFHHYFPAVLFNAMLSGVVLDFLPRNIDKAWSLVSTRPGRGVLQTTFLIVFVPTVFVSFGLFSPLAYDRAMMGKRSEDPRSEMHGLKWLSSWDF